MDPQGLAFFVCAWTGGPAGTGEGRELGGACRSARIPCALSKCLRGRVR